MFLISSGAVAMGAAVTACGAPSGTQKSDGSAGKRTVKKLVFETNSQDATAAAIVKKWNGSGKSFQVELRTTDAAQYADSFPRLATVPDAPSIAGYFVDGGHYADLAKAGSLLELSDFWKTSGLAGSVPELIMNEYHSFTPDGKVYGAPTNTSRYGCLFYRPSVLKKAGVPLPVDHEWKSEAEFDEAAAKLMAKGIDPISVGGKDGYPLSHLQDGLLSSTMDPDTIFKPLTIDYTSDAWTAPVAKLAEWNKKGYFAKGYLGRTTDQANAYFAQGKAGFSTGMNVWVPLLTKAGVPLSDLDWVLLPPIGRLAPKISLYAGGGIVIPNISVAHEQAMEFGSYLVSPEIALFSAKEGAVIPARTDVPGLKEALGAIGGSMYDKGQETGKSQFGWDDPAPTDMITYDRTNLQAVLAGTQSVESFCAQLEKLKKGHA